MSQYSPELGQAAFGAPWGEFEISEIGEAGIHYLLREMERVFWNRYQREMSTNGGDSEDWNALRSGVEFHEYWWGDGEAPEVARPNLSFDGLNIRWYKHPGRGMTVEREITPDQWSDWLNRALQAVRFVDRSM